MAEHDDTTVDEGTAVRTATRAGLGEITARPEVSLRKDPTASYPVAGQARRAPTMPPPVPQAAKRAPTMQLPSVLNRPATQIGANIAVSRTQTGASNTRAISSSMRPSSESLEPMRRRPQATPAIVSADAARELAAARAIDGSTSDALRDLVTSAAGVRAPTRPPTTPPPAPLGRESSKAIAAAHAVAPQAPVTASFGAAPELSTAEALREATGPVVRPATIPSIADAIARAVTAPATIPSIADSIARAPTVRAPTSPGSSSVPGLLATLPSLGSSPLAAAAPHGSTLLGISPTPSADSIAAPIRAAALPPPVHTVSPVVLPPYVPAPNLGDPAEAFATVPVEKFEFTEHVEKLPFALDELLGSPRAPQPAPKRTPIQQLVRFAPLIGLVALIAVFVGGYFAFDGEGKKSGAMTHVSAPAKHVINAQPALEPAARESAPATLTTESAEAKPEPTPETKPVEAKPEPTPETKPVEAKPEPTPETKPTEPAADSKPTAKQSAPTAMAPTAMAPTAMAPTAMAPTAKAATIAKSEAVAAPTVAKSEPKAAVAKSEPKAAVAKSEPKAVVAKSEPKGVAKPEPKRVATAASTKARGSLMVDSNKKAQVFIDGKSANATTPLTIQLPPGTHKLTLWDAASGKTQSMEITIATGKTTAIVKRF